MKRLIAWLKAVNQAAKQRAEIILAAKGLLGDMDQMSRVAGEKPDCDIALLLMRIGLVHIQAVYQNQMEMQNIIRSRQAPLN
jgi:hypothetical protein